jgi:tetratricopeptide (TPR) repeat protein
VAVRDVEAAHQYLDQAVALSFSRKSLDEARMGEVEAATRAIDEASPDAGVVTALVERLAQRADDCLDEDPRAAASLLRRAGDLCARDLALDEHAWTLYGRAVTAWPGEAAGADALEACGERLGRLDEVVQRYARVIDDAYDAGVARAYTQRRATILAERLGRVDEALAALQRVVEIAPKDLEAIRRWQELLERSARWQDLLIAIEREMEAGGDRTGCLRRMARIWEQQIHNAHEARQLWRRVLRGAPDDTEARDALQRLDRRSADLDDDAPPPAPPPPPPPAPAPAPVIDLAAEAKPRDAAGASRRVCRGHPRPAERVLRARRRGRGRGPGGGSAPGVLRTRGPRRRRRAGRRDRRRRRGAARPRRRRRPRGARRGGRGRACRSRRLRRRRRGADGAPRRGRVPRPPSTPPKTSTSPTPAGPSTTSRA